MMSYRPYERVPGGVMIPLSLAEWPADVPLHETMAMAPAGEGTRRPYWCLLMRPERTIDAVGGLFQAPMDLEQVAGWYRTEMERRGWWLEASTINPHKGWSSLTFARPDDEVRVDIRLSGAPGGEATRLYMHRIVEREWGGGER